MIRTNMYGRLALMIVSLVMILGALEISKVAAGPNSPTSGLEIIMLGTGAGPPLRKNRMQTATVLMVEGTPYLIDCGAGTLRRLFEMDIDPASVKSIFITHHHLDHDLGLVDLMGYAAFTMQQFERDDFYHIYGPQGTKEMVDAGVRFIRVPLRNFAAEGKGPDVKDSSFIVHEILQSGPLYQDTRITVTAQENSHYSRIRPEEQAYGKSFSFRVETQHGTIIITGDTGSSEDLERFAAGADVVVSQIVNKALMGKAIEKRAAAMGWSAGTKANFISHMFGVHLSPEAVAHLANKSKVKAVLLYHLAPGDDATPFEADQDVAGVRASFKGQVIAARDRDRYCVELNGDGNVLNACQ